MNDNRPSSRPTPRRARNALLAVAASLVLAAPALAAAQPHGGGGSEGHGGAGPGARGGAPGHSVPSHSVPSRGGPVGVYRGYDGAEQHDAHGNAGDRRGFGLNLRSAQRFHQGGYRRPEGWYAHSWRAGEFLPPLFWAQDFWLLDYWMFNLSPPPYGYVWVRDGADALLIDRTSGEIVEVIDGVFY